ncbi:TIGR01244 family sulfur transferase [Brevundimonas goettingensis]|uniref:TIGR01244 family phosphatase n=1 Tax=Brevundimonas goettingensis TaxID=2774190 RepID=A0A975C0S7_9CAUL|nr:TIGR01244 family sulfur transferase [Brevundimonas goettingensis]QTC91693.1 TIGR01244 family phosphatase [Brevundimonas goettingensis]
MSNFRQLVPGVLVSGQVLPDDLTEAVALGVRRVVNNRPDHEEPGQPVSAEIEAAARAAGLDYVHAPARGLPDAGVVEAVAAALEDGAPVLLFCKSGMRSTAAWALASSRSGALSRDQILNAAAAAGYNLGGLPL